MLRLNTCYSSTRARKMQENRLKVKRLKASIRDYLYVVLSVFVIGNFLFQFEITITPRDQGKVLAHTESVVVQEQVKEMVKEVDPRIAKLKTFLEEKKSPLAQYSELIISEADKYDIGWTQLASMSCMESACGNRLPKGSHNAWGLGGSRFMYFSSWEESIKYSSKLLGTKYKQNQNQGIKNKYCPESDGCNPNWASIVTKNTNDILAIKLEQKGGE